MAEQTEQPNKFVARIPGVLYARLKDEVKRRNMERNPVGSEKASLNSLLLYALRKELDGPGPGQRNPVEISAAKISKNLAGEFTGWVYGNNYKQRGKPTNTTGAVHAEPWYITADGKLWSAFDVTFRPDAEASPKPSAAEVAAQYGIKTLATIEEVEPRLDAESGYIQPSIVVGADLSDERFRRDFIAEFGRQAWDRAIRIPSFKKAKWPERFEMAREQKERGE